MPLRLHHFRKPSQSNCLPRSQTMYLGTLGSVYADALTPGPSPKGEGILGLGNRSQESADGFTGWLALERGDTHHSPGEVVDDDRHPVAERPTLRQREWQPTGPEAAGRHGRQIDVPDVPRIFGRDDAFFRVRFGFAHERFMPRLLLEHPANSRRAKVQACSGKRLSSASSGPGGPRNACRSESCNRQRSLLYTLRGLIWLQAGHFQRPIAPKKRSMPFLCKGSQLLGLVARAGGSMENVANNGFARIEHGSRTRGNGGVEESWKLRLFNGVLPAHPYQDSLDAEEFAVPPCDDGGVAAAGKSPVIQRSVLSTIPMTCGFRTGDCQ